jgi:hypothetical protein
MVSEITIDLRDGRRVTFDEVVVVERDNGEWLRCVKDEPSSRQKFPETTKYYHLAGDVERMVVEPDGEATEPPSECDPLNATAIADAVPLGEDRTRCPAVRRILE